MLEAIFGSSPVEKILFYLLKNRQGYPSELKEKLNLPLFTIQRTLARLEKGNILYCNKVGKTLIYKFNPRYPFLKELLEFLDKAFIFLPLELQKIYIEKSKRRRPRRHDKPLKRIKDL